MTLQVTTDRKEIYDTLIAWIVAATGFSADNIIWLNQEISRPSKPYAGILITNRGVKTGEDDVIQSFDDPSQKIQRLNAGPRQLNVQVEVYTDPATEANDSEADEILENMLLALETEEVRDLFRTAKIGFLRQDGGINRLDEQLGERWERRAQVDIVITYSGEIFDDGATSGNWIETVEIPTEENGNLIIQE